MRSPAFVPPPLPAGYDLYLAPWGSDTGTGSRSSPWRSSTKLTAALGALTSGQSRTAYLAAGTYGSLYVSPPAADTTSSAVVTLAPGCVIDTRGTLNDGIGAAGAMTITFHLNGALLYGSGTNGGNSPNGIGAHQSAVVTVYGSPDGSPVRASVVGFADGTSAHSTSRTDVFRTVFAECDKACFANINTTVANYTDCVFAGRAAASNGLGSHQSTGAVTYTRCVFAPASAGQTAEFGRGAYTLTNCEVGSTGVRVAISSGNASATEDGTLTDCYLNATLDARTKTAFTRCYGRISMRVRGATTVSDLVMRNCVWVGRPTGAATDFIYANFDPNDGTWDGIGYDIRDTIVTGYTTAVGSGFSANQITKFNAGSSLTYCCLSGNTTNYAASVTGTATTGNITSDPLIGSAASTVQSDYGYGAGSPCIGAGFGGGNIGFAA